MSDVRKSLTWIAAFIAVVLAGDRMLAWIAQQILVRSQFRYSRLYRGGTDADIVILGDSRGVNSFYAPAMETMTGERVFNLSYNSMSPAVAEALLMDYLERNRKPKLMIVEVTSAIVSGEVLTELRPYAGMSPRLMALYAAKHPYAAIASRVFHLLPLNSSFAIEALHYMRRGDQDWIMRTVMPPERQVRERDRLRPMPGSMEALGRMAQTCRQRGIEVRLLIAPYYKDIGNLPWFLGELARAVQPDAHVRIGNYANAIQDPEAFADHVHLNERGSVQFLELLRRDLFIGM